MHRGRRPVRMSGVNMTVPIWVDLPEPREPDASERAVLDALVAYPSCAILAEQASSVVVTATCVCGCSSLRLRTGGAAVPADRVARLSSEGRDDYVGVHATADGRDGARIQVVLHVAGGLLTELEVFVREGVAVDLPAAGRLRDLHIV